MVKMAGVALVVVVVFREAESQAAPPVDKVKARAVVELSVM
jgi:hypothetical protein